MNTQQLIIENLSKGEKITIKSGSNRLHSRKKQVELS